jgi:hypothetical protein
MCSGKIRANFHEFIKIELPKSERNLHFFVSFSEFFPGEPETPEARPFARLRSRLDLSFTDHQHS